MKKHKVLSIFIAFCMILTSSFSNESYGESIRYFNELEVEEMLLSDLIYDDYILNQKIDNSINMENYKEFYGRCKSYIDRGDIMYTSINQIKERLSKYKLKTVKTDKKSGFEGAVFERNYNGKKHLTVVFRGTEMDSIADISTDITEVFLNIYNIFNNQRNHAKDLVKTALEYKADELSVTGHSLGGFLAQVVAVDMQKNKIDTSNINTWYVSTFNAPGSTYKLDFKNMKNIEITPEYKEYCDDLQKKSKSYSNVTNYIIEGDAVGEYGTHVGNIVRYKNDDLSLSISKFHSLYNFHKYGDWYKTYLSQLIIKSVYKDENFITGRALPGKTVKAYINNKEVGSTTAQFTGIYTIKIPKQKEKAKIEVRCSGLDSNTTTVKSKIKVNNIYFDQKNITGKTYPNSEVQAYKSDDEIKISKKVISDSNGNFTINLANTYPSETYIRIEAKKTLYPVATAKITVLKKDIPKLDLNTVYSESTNISGTTISKATVKAYVGSKKIGSTTADKNGAFKISIAKQAAGKEIKIVSSKINYNNSEKKLIVKKSKIVDLSVNPKRYSDTTITGKTTPGSTVKAFYGRGNIGKTAVADNNGTFIFTLLLI